MTPDKQTTSLIGSDQVMGSKVVPMNGLQGNPNPNRARDI
jgi:hypothetical protein